MEAYKCVSNANRSATSDYRRPLTVPSAPWLISTSLDGYRWEISGGSGAIQETAEINFNIDMPDGTRLGDVGNEQYYAIAVGYAEVIRLYMPAISAHTHSLKARHLLMFLYWLRLHHVRSLADVTEDHIALYQESVALGREWVVQAPQRLATFIRNTLSSGGSLPLVPRGNNRLAAGEIYKAAGVSYPGMGKRNDCSRALLDYVEANTPCTTLPPLEEVLATQSVAPRIRSVPSVYQSLLPLEEIWLWREHLPTPNLVMNPYRRGAMSVAKTLGVVPGRTPSIPPKVAFKYLAGAMKWVLEYAPIILNHVESHLNVQILEETLQGMRLNISIINSSAGIYVKDRQVGPIGIFHPTGMYIKGRRVGVYGLMRLLSAACFSVIAALSARRADEIEDLGAGCYTLDDDKHAWLIVYIEKTLQKYDKIPVPTSVLRAIECLEQISKGARDNSKNDSLWQWLDESSGEVMELAPWRILDSLAEFNDVFADTEPRWHFTPHQFRRFFALLYFWRYEKGDLAALAHHLRHFDLEMTRHYVTDVEFNRIWMEAETEWKESFLREVIEGSRSVGGRAGVRLKREIKKLLALYRKHVEVVAPERTFQKLKRLADRWGSEFKQFVWGTICACPKRTALATHAKCKGAHRVGPVYANAREELCSQCPFAIRSSRFNQKVSERIKSNTSIIAGCKPGSLVSELAQINVHTLESVLLKAEAFPLQVEAGNE